MIVVADTSPLNYLVWPTIFRTGLKSGWSTPLAAKIRDGELWTPANGRRFRWPLPIGHPFF
jgi:hypothetical protein